jgi:hypothetical protein
MLAHRSVWAREEGGGGIPAKTIKEMKNISFCRDFKKISTTEKISKAVPKFSKDHIMCLGMYVCK